MCCNGAWAKAAGSLAVLGLLCVCGQRALAQSPADRGSGSDASAPGSQTGEARLVLDVEGGFGGTFVRNKYNPIFLTLSSVKSGTRASVEVTSLGHEDMFGDPSQARKTLATSEVQVVVPGSGRALSVPVLIRSDAVRLSVLVTLDDGRTADRKLELDWEDDSMTLVLTQRRPELSFLSDAIGQLVFAESSVLPGDWRAYDCVDLIVLDDLDVRNLDTDVVRAIENAVAWGADLLVTGPGLATNAGASLLGPLGEVEVAGGLPPTSLPELERWFFPAAKDAGSLTPLPLLELSGDERSTLLSSDGRSIVLKGHLLRSSVIACAFDPVDLAWENETASYQARAACWRRLWGAACERDGDDLAIEQVVGSLVPGEARVSGRVVPVAVLLGIFAIVLGPVNLLVIRRARRREWMLLTVPGAVVVFLVAAAVVFRAAIPERDVLCAETVVQATPGSEAAVEVCYFGVLPRKQGPQDMVIAPGAKIMPPEDDMDPWSGRTGMEARPLHTFEGFMPAFGTRVDHGGISAPISTSIRLDNVWQRPRAMRFFASGWVTDVSTPQAAARLGEDGLVGSFTNTFGETLHGVAAALGWRRTELGDISPGETVSFVLPVGPPHEFVEADESAIAYMSDLAWLDPGGECVTCGPFELDTAEHTLIAEESQRTPSFFRRPLVLGWGGDESPVTSSDAELRSRRLYLVSVPVTPLAGKEIIVPAGLLRPSRSNVGAALVDPSAEAQWSGGTYVFQLPVAPGRFSDCALTVYTHGSAPRWVSDLRPIRLAALDWRKGAWEGIGESPAGLIVHTIEDAVRFVKEPEGWIAIALEDPFHGDYDVDWETWRGYPVDLTYLDVSLEGRR